MRPAEMIRILALVAACVLSACARNNLQQGEATGTFGGASTAVVPFPHPPDWKEPENHGPYALDSGPTLAMERCRGCHDLEGSDVNIGPPCKSCHGVYPHIAGWGESNLHVRKFKESGSLAGQIQIECATRCHGVDLAGGLSGVSCNKCHTGFPHPVGWQEATEHGLTVLSNSSVELGACGKCHGATLNGADFAPSCRSCHTFPDASSPVQHAPVTPSTCSSCHATQSSEINGPHLLKSVAPTLCWTSGCHTTGKTPAAYTHSVVTSGNACMNCHAPHDASQAKLLKAPLQDVCFSCHFAEIASVRYGTTRNMKAIFQGSSNLHSPFKNGNCGTCHDVHGGSNNHLLKTTDPMFIIPPSATAADLANFSCFTSGCHAFSTYVATPTFPNPAVVTHPSSALPTQFVRLGSTTAENLHAVHVVSFGFGCLACHDPHGNNDAHLLRPYLTHREPGVTAFWNQNSCDGCHTDTFPAGYPNGLW